MELITFNLNGIRAATKKGLLEWLGERNPDIVCFQEVKANPDQIDLSPLEQMGYQIHWHSAEKKGYSGVATLTKKSPSKVRKGIKGNDDPEGRILTTKFPDFTLVNTYIPSGTTGDIRQDFKYKWLDDFGNYIESIIRQNIPVIICGDFNICHKPIDIHNPVSNKNSSGFLPEEREWLTKFFDKGLVDCFREFHPEPHQYTWWTYRANAKANNKGWRIDYFAASQSLLKSISDCQIMPDIHFSDHCPVSLTLKT